MLFCRINVLLGLQPPFKGIVSYGLEDFYEHVQTKESAAVERNIIGDNTSKTFSAYEWAL